MAEIRDVAIIVLAVIFVVVLLGTSVLGISLFSLYKTARKKAEPLVDSVLRTLDTVHGTSSFVSKTAVRPTMRVARIAGAARTGLTVANWLTKRRRRRRG